ncbi:putative glycolipid-binding domain-containing protein [Pseudomonas sp. UBA6323]|uniref:putative glycolipid-binding domain-containing protein n=1 Tax=Pseudomonas sp. UBA6323 TaxID=1947329 RepID=UPI0025D6DF68|nr:putative glycolipid-binding domain-containing protein [Pseudomonas sp. UBA6323]
MQQTLVWKPRHTPGVETLRLNQDAHGIHATSHLMQVIRGNSIAANYLIDCDARWRFRRLWLKVDNHGQRKLSLERDLRGNWLLNGELRPELQRCQHVMLSASPFTHTPLLQRSALETGQSDEMQVAYIDLVNLKVEPRQQRYQCLHRRPGENLYRSQAENQAQEELSVDDQVLLLNANEHYLRLNPRELKVSTLV